MKTFFIYFAILVILFIISAITLGEYYSALTGVVFYIAGIIVAKYVD